MEHISKEVRLTMKAISQFVWSTATVIGLTLGPVLPAMAHSAPKRPQLVRLKEAGEPVYLYQSGSYHWIPTHKIMLGLGYTYGKTVWRTSLPAPIGHPLTLFETANKTWYWYDVNMRAFYQVTALQPGVQYEKWTGQLRGTLPYLINGQAIVQSSGHVQITQTYATPEIPHPTVSPWHTVTGTILTSVTVPIGWVHGVGPEVESWSPVPSNGSYLAVRYVPRSAIAEAQSLAKPGTQLRAWPHNQGFFLIRHTPNWTYRSLILPGPQALLIQTKTLPGQGSMARTMLTSYHLGTAPNLLATEGLPPEIAHLP